MNRYKPQIIPAAERELAMSEIIHYLASRSTSFLLAIRDGLAREGRPRLIVRRIRSRRRDIQTSSFGTQRVGSPRIEPPRSDRPGA